MSCSGSSQIWVSTYIVHERTNLVGVMSFLILPGEKLTKEEAKNLMKELCEPEDDEGFMPFMRKFVP